ncbi:flagellar hook-length control protein FliK [Paenalcaligenes suwonensis]|uniref:flagellar hook-length control protein FliK n=1 Tax=Paenalcaligenes suwonensis TaxID=1202713 RepID=UPI001A99D40D|nr:flagellar hook-length control protein FliK [Paenalcaligenes suwonensis]
MTTQALTLVAPVSASAPTTAAAQSSPDTDSFASVLASQNEGGNSKEGATDSVITLPSHTPRDKQKLDSLLDVAEETDDSADSALSMIATTLFIAAESVSIQQGLRQHVAANNADSNASDAAFSHAKTADNLPQRSRLPLSDTTPALSKPMLETSNDGALRFTNAALPHDVSTAPVDTKASSNVAQPALAKNESTASVLSTAPLAGKTAVLTDNVKAALSSLPAAHTPVSTQAEQIPLAQDTPTVTTAIASATSNITTLATPGSSPVLQSSLHQPLSSPAWGQEFSKTMVSFSRQGIQHAELRLDPPELGPLRISLKLSDNIAHAYIVSAHANVRQAVEQALPQLQQALAQSGLSLGHTDVSDQPSEQAFLFQQGSEESSSESASSNRFDDLLHGRTSSSTETTAPPVRRAIPDALVDTFA